ncbi:uncharacterized protein LOC128239077 [Mya arenaria]|uniref:uncharacterized protein LOC128239077 n=1 Tax=Mya arenaria TaxID=6604 RepID=UPI0022E80D2E|nr:uncharacterized protein LOC128239077 [Mya arenaria]
MAANMEIADFNQEDFESDVYRDRKRLLVTIISQPDASCKPAQAISGKKKIMSEKRLKLEDEIDVDVYQLYHNLFGNYFCYVRDKDITYDIKKSFADVEKKLASLKKSEKKKNTYDFFLYAFLTFHSITDDKSHIHFAANESKPLEDVLGLLSKYTPEEKPMIVLIQADYLTVNDEKVVLPGNLDPNTLLIMSTVPQQQTSNVGNPVTQPEQDPEYGQHTDPNPKCSLLMQVFDDVMTGKAYRGFDMEKRAEMICAMVREKNGGSDKAVMYKSSLSLKLIL